MSLGGCGSRCALKALASQCNCLLLLSDTLWCQRLVVLVTASAERPLIAGLMHLIVPFVSQLDFSQELRLLVN